MFCKRLIAGLGSVQVNRRPLVAKYHQEWDALPRERKLKVIEEAIAVEEEYQVSLPMYYM